MASDELNGGSLAEAKRYLALAIAKPTSVPAERRGSFQLRVAVFRLLLARQRGDLPAVVEEARRLLAPAKPLDEAQLGPGEDLRALALINLGIAELWTCRDSQVLTSVPAGRRRRGDRQHRLGVRVALDRRGPTRTAPHRVP